MGKTAKEEFEGNMFIRIGDENIPFKNRNQLKDILKKAKIVSGE